MPTVASTKTVFCLQALLILLAASSIPTSLDAYCDTCRASRLVTLCVQVMIFDYDVHHGNGIHDVFYGDLDILFILSCCVCR